MKDRIYLAGYCYPFIAVADGCVWDSLNAEVCCVNPEHSHRDESAEEIAHVLNFYCENVLREDSDPGMTYRDELTALQAREIYRREGADWRGPVLVSRRTGRHLAACWANPPECNRGWDAWTWRLDGGNNYAASEADAQAKIEECLR